MYLSDGRYLSIHGYDSRLGLVVGDVAFVPLSHHSPAAYSIGNRPYGKPYFDEGRGREYSHSGIVRSPEALGRFPLFGLLPGKSVLFVDSKAEVITSREMYVGIEGTARGAVVERILSWLWQRTRLPSSKYQIGLTGSVGLSSRGTPHDFDIVFHGTTAVLSELVKALQHVSKSVESARLVEYGKSWRIRLSTPHGVLCPFFAPTDAHSLGLADDVLALVDYTIERDAVIEGVVTNSRLGFATPAILHARTGTTDRLVIADFDLRSRGDLAVGERVEVRGTLLRSSGTGPDHLICRASDGVRSLDPPWEHYYIDEP